MFCQIVKRQTKKLFYSTVVTAPKSVTNIQLQDWVNKHQQTWDNNSLVIVDVRERNEIEQTGKIKGSLNVPSKLELDMFSAGLSDIPKESTVVFQCASGHRSDAAALMAEKDLGFKNAYSLKGGIKEWKGPLQAFMNNHSPWVHHIFDTDTGTAQYVVTDLETKEAYMIDPVLNYDPFSAKVHPLMAKQLIKFIEKYGLNVSKIIDTHVHADHLTAAFYLKSELSSKPEFWIGSNVTEIQKVFGEKYNIDSQELSPTGEQFDRLVSPDDVWKLGKDIQCSVLSTPGHTPACMSYRIGDTAFVGDTLFMPDIGTARCDFPGGSAEQLYKSIHEMYKSWPDDTRIYTGHDYPPADRLYQVVTSLEQQKKANKMINEKVSLQEFIKSRQERDATLKAPRYIHPSIQTNLRGGILPTPEVSVHNKNMTQKQSFFKIPVRWMSV